MRFSMTAAALVATVAAADYYPVAPPAYNSTSIVETYPESTPSYPEASSAPVYITKTVSEYETYCPGPTEVVTNDKTYTVTEATTLTITDCPCTVIETPSYVPGVPVVPTVTPVTPEAPVETPVYHVPSNGTAPAAVYPTGTGAPAPAKSSPPPFLGAGAITSVSFGAVALGALAAFL